MRPNQASLPLGNTWGGFRKGAGRKRTGDRRRLPHVSRPAHCHRHPVHVTVRVRQGLPSLREQSLFLSIRAQIDAAKRRFLRIVHFSVQSNHVHLLVEASDRGRLSSGMKGLGVRVARAVNGLLGARGRVWDDRYHARALKTPREVRNALVYVLFNHRKHGRAAVVDACSSAPFHDGWVADAAPSSGAPSGEARGSTGGAARASPGATDAARASREEWPVVRGATWLMTCGWKRLGLLERHERPA